MIREVIISEFWKDVDELLDEYAPTPPQVNVTTGPVSVGTIVFDDDGGAMKIYNGTDWVEFIPKKSE